jgi:hypothetical protein
VAVTFGCSFSFLGWHKVELSKLVACPPDATKMPAGGKMMRPLRLFQIAFLLLSLLKALSIMVESDVVPTEVPTVALSTHVKADEALPQLPQPVACVLLVEDGCKPDKVEMVAAEMPSFAEGARMESHLLREAVKSPQRFRLDVVR